MRHLLASQEWGMQFESSLGEDGRVHYHADIFRADVFVKRISLTDKVPNKIAAEVALTAQVRKWVSDYETKPHTGNTDFGELGSL